MGGPDLADEEDRKYELPDGKIIEVEHTIRYPSTEIIFNPSIINRTDPSIQDMVLDSFEKCDPDLRVVSRSDTSRWGEINKLFRIYIYLFVKSMGVHAKEIGHSRASL